MGDRVVIIDHGTVVTAGRPDELVWPRGVEVEAAAGTRVIAGVRRDDAPRIVAELVAAGERVYGVRVLSSTLEDVCLDAAGGSETTWVGGTAWARCSRAPGSSPPTRCASRCGPGLRRRARPD